MSDIKDKTCTMLFPQRAGKLALHGEIPIANEHMKEFPLILFLCLQFNRDHTLTVRKHCDMFVLCLC